MLEYQINKRDSGIEYIAIFSDELDYPLVATSQHPNYQTVKDILNNPFITELDKVEEIEELLNIEVVVAREFDAITERVSVSNGIVYFDGDPVDNSITDQIIRFLREGHNVLPLSLFMENLYQNPNHHSREQLYSWLKAKDFTINSDGYIYAYKGVKSDFTSINAGYGVVNKKESHGNLDNSIGNEIEMPRTKVEFNPALGCSTGLHVGTYDFAKSFAPSGGKVLGVIVNPRDIVSVPTDSGAQKVRTCRYTVIEEVETVFQSAYYGSDTYSDDVIDYDEWDEEYVEDYPYPEDPWT